MRRNRELISATVNFNVPSSVSAPDIFEVNIKSLIHKDNREGQLILLKRLIFNNLDLECLKWVLFFNVPNVPSFIQRRIDFVMDQIRQMDDHRMVQQNRKYLDQPPPPIRRMEEQQQQPEWQQNNNQRQGEQYNHRTNDDFLF